MVFERASKAEESNNTKPDSEPGVGSFDFDALSNADADSKNLDTNSESNDFADVNAHFDAGGFACDIKSKSSCTYRVDPVTDSAILNVDCRKPGNNSAKPAAKAEEDSFNFSTEIINSNVSSSASSPDTDSSIEEPFSNEEVTGAASNISERI